MKMTGNVINGGTVQGEAVVLGVPFSFVGDFDPETGALLIEDNGLYGKSIADKILVCTTGKGGTVAPFIAYQAKQARTAPAAIICETAGEMLSESAILIDIPLIEGLEKSRLKMIKQGQEVSIKDGTVQVE